MADTDYTNQFSQIQDSLHKRLERITKLANEKDSKKKKQTKGDIFGVSDDLSLTSNASSTIDNSVCTRDNCLHATANDSLQSEVRELKDETGRLRKYVAEKEYQVKQFMKKIDKLEEERLILAGQDAPAAAPTKIIELSKKNRDLSAVVESEKNKAMQLQRKVKDLEMKLQKNQSPKSTKSPSKEKEELASEQLQIINMKLIESRNQVQTLKQEIKIAHKVLGQEIGEENLNFSSLLKDSQGYRGRAVQILALQAKIKDLERKVRGSEENSTDKNFTRIKMVEKARKDSIEGMKIELATAQSELQEVNKKYESLKSRNKVLAGEVKSLKSQITMLTDKGQHDNELIDTLMKQQDQLQHMMQNISSQQNDAVQKQATTSKVLYEHDQQSAAQIAQLKSLLEEREERVRELESAGMSTVREGGSLRDSIELGRGRLSARREKTKTTTETGTLTEEHELDSQKSLLSSQSSGSTSSGEQRQLEMKCAELAAMLKAVETEKEKISQINDQLTEREEKLSTELCKIVENKEKLNHGKSKTTPRGDQSSRLAETPRDYELSLQIDENNALKETLRSIQEAHTEDCRIYKEMIQETKQVFLDTLRGLVQQQ